MWCDDLDVDLLKVVPASRALLDSVADVRLITRGNTSGPGGKLNHPSVWNTHEGPAAYFGFLEPCAPAGYTTTAPLVACGLDEALRDAWAHTYVMFLEGKKLFNGFVLRGTLTEILQHTRGWRILEKQALEEIHNRVLVALNATIRRARLLSEKKGAAA